LFKERELNKRPDFENQRYLGLDTKEQALTNLVKAMEKTLSPEGVLSSNTKHMGVVLAKDISDPINGKNYHVYVMNVHRAKMIPIVIYSPDASPIKELSKEDKDRAYTLSIAGDFNDSTSYCRVSPGAKWNPAKGRYPLVWVEYGAVIGGVPSNGEIVGQVFVEGQPRYISPEDLKVLSGAGILADGYAFSANAPKAPPERSTNTQDKYIQQQCSSVKRGYQGYFNFQGDRLWFDTKKCKDLKNIIVKKAAAIQSSKGAKQNLLPNLSKRFNTLFSAIPGSPYLLSGVGEYTPNWAYGMSENISKIRANKEVDSTDKNYVDFYKSKGILSDDGYLKKSYDCSGIPAWLAFHSGFILGIKDYVELFNADKLAKSSNSSERGFITRMNTNYNRLARGAFAQGMNTLGLRISIEQFAATPGAWGGNTYTKRGQKAIGHAYVSAGKGITSTENGVHTVPIYEAANFGYQARVRNAKFKMDGKVIRRIDFGLDEEETFLGLPASFVYADAKGLFIGSPNFAGLVKKEEKKAIISYKKSKKVQKEHAKARKKEIEKNKQRRNLGPRQ
tara:strand:- start:7381 stop:9063 length:1683 start_codon:yes stop_codon:yes gene_type:complete